MKQGRFDKLVYVPPPTAQERRDIVRLYASRLLLSDEFGSRSDGGIIRFFFSFSTVV